MELTPERLNAILEEIISPTYDWSAETIAECTLDDLDPKAVQKAREEYKSVHPRVADGSMDGKIWNYLTELALLLRVN